MLARLYRYLKLKSGLWNGAYKKKLNGAKLWKQSVMTTNRPINKIIIHCSDTPASMDIGAKEIDQWHKERGWLEIGYHDVMRRTGEIEEGRSVDKVGAHTKGHNKDSIGVCMVGGYNGENNFTEAQFKSLARLIRAYRAMYPNAVVNGHRDFSNKQCPSFDVHKWMEENGLV